MPSFKFVGNLQNVLFCRQSITKKTIFSICFCRLRATNSITVPPAGLFYMPRPLHSLLQTYLENNRLGVNFLCRLRATNIITVPPAGLFYMPRPLHSLLRTCVNFHGKCVSFLRKCRVFSPNKYQIQTYPRLQCHIFHTLYTT